MALKRLGNKAHAWSQKRVAMAQAHAHVKAKEAKELARVLNRSRAVAMESVLTPLSKRTRERFLRTGNRLKSASGAAARARRKAEIISRRHGEEGWIGRAIRRMEGGQKGFVRVRIEGPVPFEGYLKFGEPVRFSFKGKKYEARFGTRDLLVVRGPDGNNVYKFNPQKNEWVLKR